MAQLEDQSIQMKHIADLTVIEDIAASKFDLDKIENI